MVDFITLGCETEEVSFFTSGSYARASFSGTWRTASVPETDSLGSIPVYLQVLEKFNIPVDSSGGLPPGGFLPGIDIKHMDAVQAIRLSMAEALLLGQWWELYEDVEGGVKFVNVFDNGSPGKIVTLDVRLCIPSASKDNEVDMVIVHGYKKPPQRFAREFRDVVPAGTGPINPANVTGEEDLFTVDFASLVGTCLQSQLATEATKSYRDPVFTNQFGVQETNPFYDVKAHESIVAYVIDVEGMDAEKVSAAQVKYDFSTTTTWYFRPNPAFPTFTRVSEITAGGCDATGLQTGATVDFYEGEIKYQSPTYKDRYNDDWPLVTRPAEILYLGYKVDRLVNFGGFGGDDSTTFLYVSAIPELNKLAEGSQWIYTVEDRNNYTLNMYYQPKIDPVVWDLFLLALGGGTDLFVKVNDGREKSLDLSNDMVDSRSGIGLLGGQNHLGHFVTDMWLGVTLDRPSVTVRDPGGNALELAARLHLRYAPIILLNEPAPIAYKHKDAGSVIVDQTVGLEDQDPTTCQNFDEENPVNVMQNLAIGNVIDMNLPFCEDAAACLKVAETVFDYQNYAAVNTFTLTCGPDDEPILGAAVDGYDTNLRIETVNYSFQDSSAYTIEVTLGPVFANVGGWNNGAWIPKTQDVNRKGIIKFTAGDGTNYRVYVQGLGEFNAINSTQTVWRVGEFVDVTVYNIPQETF